MIESEHLEIQRRRADHWRVNVTMDTKVRTGVTHRSPFPRRSVILPMNALVALVVVAGLTACSTGHPASSTLPSTTSQTSDAQIKNIWGVTTRRAVRLPGPLPNLMRDLIDPDIEAQRAVLEALADVD